MCGHKLHSRVHCVTERDGSDHAVSQIYTFQRSHHTRWDPADPSVSQLYTFLCSHHICWDPTENACRRGRCSSGTGYCGHGLADVNLFNVRVSLQHLVDAIAWQMWTLMFFDVDHIFLWSAQMTVSGIHIWFFVVFLKILSWFMLCTCNITMIYCSCIYRML